MMERSVGGFQTASVPGCWCAADTGPPAAVTNGSRLPQAPLGGTGLLPESAGPHAPGEVPGLRVRWTSSQGRTRGGARLLGKITAMIQLPLSEEQPMSREAFLDVQLCGSSAAAPHADSMTCSLSCTRPRVLCSDKAMSVPLLSLNMGQSVLQRYLGVAVPEPSAGPVAA